MQDDQDAYCVEQDRDAANHLRLTDIMIDIVIVGCGLLALGMAVFAFRGDDKKPAEVMHAANYGHLINRPSIVTFTGGAGIEYAKMCFDQCPEVAYGEFMEARVGR